MSYNRARQKRRGTEIREGALGRWGVLNQSDRSLGKGIKTAKNPRKRNAPNTTGGGGISKWGGKKKKSPPILQKSHAVQGGTGSEVGGWLK